MEWYEWDSENETHEECEFRRMERCPILTPVQLEVLRQLVHATSDGYVISKSARGDLHDLRLITRWNGWQVITREGLAVLEFYGYLRSDKVQCAYSKKSW